MSTTILVDNQEVPVIAGPCRTKVWPPKLAEKMWMAWKKKNPNLIEEDGWYFGASYAKRDRQRGGKTGRKKRFLGSFG